VTSPAGIRSVDVTGVRLPRATSLVFEGGPLWVEVRPDLARLHVLAGDVLAEMGKRRDLAGKGRNESEDVAHAAAWAVANGASDLVITEAQRLHPIILGGLVRLAKDVNVPLWLLHRPPRTDAFMRSLNRRGASDLVYGQVPCRRPLAAPQPLRPDVSLPSVPGDEFVTFRDACQRMLTGVDADRVDARFTATARLCDQLLTAGGANRAAVSTLLHELLNAVPTDAELTVDIRALQVACWNHDLHVQVNLARLLASEERPRVDPHIADEALTAYRQPYRAITVALTRAGCGVADLTDIPLGAANVTGDTIAIGGDRIALGTQTARAVRAQRFLRNASGAAPRDRLLPHTPKALAKALAEAATDLGIQVAGRRAERTRDRTGSALRALGVTVTSIP
jgi:hypothetical protein